MAAIAPVVGIGLSAISTVSALGQQSQNARLQEESLAQQAFDAKQRLALAKEEQGYAAQQAQVTKDQELMLNQAQRTQTLAGVREAGLQQELANVQASVQEGQLRSSAAVTASQLMQQANQQQSQTSLGNADELQGVNQAAGAGQTALANQRAAGRGSLAQEQQVVLGTAELAGRVRSNVNLRDATSLNQLEYNRQVGQQAIDSGNLQAGYLNQTNALQNSSTQLGLQSQRQQINMQTRRNANAINTANYSRQAAGNLQYLQQSIDTRGQLSQIDAQRQSIQRPGFLSYAGAAAQAGFGVYQSGILSGSGNGAAQFGTTNGNLGLMSTSVNRGNYTGAGNTYGYTGTPRNDINFLPPSGINYMPPTATPASTARNA